MFSRVAQIARHLSRPVPLLQTTNKTSSRFVGAKRLGMASTTAEERSSKTIHTAACLIIGDEVLGGKASSLAGKLCVKCAK